MDISELGEFKLVDELTSGFGTSRASTVKAVGDDSAVFDMPGDRYMLVSTDLLLEGIHFDLTYTPLRYLGYKSVVAAMSDICAMNGIPMRVLVAVGVSARFAVEDLKELYEGIRLACDEYDIELAGGDTAPSLTGMTLSLTAVGEVDKTKIAYRSGAKDTDLVCVTGDLGGAYMGLKLLDREKKVLRGNEVAKPQFEGFEYLLERQLKPRLRTDVIRELDEAGIVPTAMIDLSDGLASDLKQICKASDTGARIYLERLPIASKTFELADQLHIDPVVAALNGGDDYELLFTVPLTDYEKVVRIGGVDVVGHITPPSKGVALTTPDGAEIVMQAQGWKE